MHLFYLFMITKTDLCEFVVKFTNYEIFTCSDIPTIEAYDLCGESQRKVVRRSRCARISCRACSQGDVVLGHFHQSATQIAPDEAASTTRAIARLETIFNALPIGGNAGQGDFQPRTVVQVNHPDRLRAEGQQPSSQPVQNSGSEHGSV